MWEVKLFCPSFKSWTWNIWGFWFWSQFVDVLKFNFLNLKFSCGLFADFSFYHGFSYTLSPDGKACFDIDECLAGGPFSSPCGQVCINTRGSFKCGCAQNFTLNRDGITCKADVDPLLLFGSDSQVNWISPDGHHLGILAKGHHSFVSVGIDFLEENGSTTVSFVAWKILTFHSPFFPFLKYWFSIFSCFLFNSIF